MLKEFLIVLTGLIFLGAIVFIFSKNIKKTLKIVSGWGLYEAYNFMFDFVLWPIIQYFFGFIGIALLILIALINNFLVLMWYQKKKVDWFGVNVLEDIKLKGHIWVHQIDNHKNLFKKISLYIPAKILQLIIWLLNKNDVFAFVTLSVWQDSFITTIFLRHGKFDKLDKRDYFVFMFSTIVSCFAWSFIMQLAIIVYGLFLQLL